MTEAPREPAESPPGRPSGAVPRPSLVRLALAFYGVLLALAVGGRLWADGALPLFAGPEAAAAGLRPLRDLAAGGALAAALVAASRVWTRRSAAGRRLARALAETVGPLGHGEIALLAGVSGVAEEAFFRGALQPHLGLLATSVLFALAHLAPRRELAPWAGFALVGGLAFGALFELTGSVLAPALAHVAVNAWNLRWLVGPGARLPA